jgi:hypothetical protein
MTSRHTTQDGVVQKRGGRVWAQLVDTVAMWNAFVNARSPSEARGCGRGCGRGREQSLSPSVASNEAFPNQR